MAREEANADRLKMAQRMIAKLAVLGVLLACLLSVRMHNFVGVSGIQKLVDCIWLISGMLGFAIALTKEAKSTLVIALGFLTLLAHSYAKLFEPSLAPDVPELDYLFFDSISSNYCFSLAKTYLINLAIAFFAFHGFFSVHSNDKANSLNFVFMLVCGALMVNLAVVAVQGSVSLNFLGQGSGSAIEAGRAAGLLEDSGASTVVLSSGLVFVLAWLLELDLTAFQRGVTLTVWMGAALVGVLTGGRSYLSLLLLGAFCLLGFKALQSKWVTKKYWLLAALAIGAVALTYFYQRAATGMEYSAAFKDDPWLARLMAWFDPVRGIHTAILLRAIPEYWPEGIGLGGSHIAIAQFQSEFASRPVVISGDAPLNLYLGFLLETGLGGLVILLLIAFLMLQLCMRCLQEHKRRPADVPMAVLLISLLISGMVGSHTIFRSFSCLLGIPLAYIYSYPQKQKWLDSTIYLTALVVFYFATISGLKVLDPPRVPEFYWSRQGKPQLPLGYNVPIATPQKSQWMAPGVPFAVNQTEIEFFVEMPPEHYPIVVTAEVFSVPEGKLIQEHRFEPVVYDAASPGRILSLKLHPTVAEYCTKHFSPKAYCYAKVFTDPVWSFSPEARIGFSLINHSK